jgi:hypothetical protein
MSTRANRYNKVLAPRAKVRPPLLQVDMRRRKHRKSASGNGDSWRGGIQADRRAPRVQVQVRGRWAEVRVKREVKFVDYPARILTADVQSQRWGGTGSMGAAVGGRGKARRMALPLLCRWGMWGGGCLI